MNVSLALRKRRTSGIEWTRFVDRLWPGQWLGAWAYRCASSEGGHGGFVMNRQGSGAGGQLQFLSSTFYGIIGSAILEARVDVLERRLELVDHEALARLGDRVSGTLLGQLGRRDAVVA